MKVRDFVKRYRMCSNADVFLVSPLGGEETKLKESDLRNVKPIALMDMTLKSFEVIDNVLTIYAIQDGRK